MKKITKTLTAGLLAAAATANMFAIPATHVAHAATGTEVVKGDVISAKAIPSSGRVGHPLNIPAMSAAAFGGSATTITNVANIKPVVTRPDGRSIALTADSSNGGWTFSPTVAGTYKLVYKGTNSAGVETVSETFSIKVVAETYQMNFDVNDSIILPSTVDTNASRFEGGAVKAITLPNPTVKDANGFVIYKNGALSALLAEYKTLKEDSSRDSKEEARFAEVKAELLESSVTTEDADSYITTKLSVYVTTESSFYDSNRTIDDQQGRNYILHKTGNNYDFVPEAGTNVIRYVLESSTGAALFSKTETVLGSDTYDHTKIKLGFSAADRPTTASLNEKVRLPYASAYNRADANNAVNSRTILSVKLVNGTTKTDVEVQYDEDGAYFIPDVNEGNYEITYNVEDYYGNTATAYSYRIEKVIDSKAPTMYLVEGFKAVASTEEGYAALADAVIEMQNAEYKIPTKVKEGSGKIVFPAMFATDSVKAYENLTFSRQITSTALENTVDLLNTEYLIAEGTENVDDLDKDPQDPTKRITTYQRASREAEIDLTDLDDVGGKLKFPAGEYTVTYTVRDNSGYSASKSFKFIIEKDFEDADKPVITYGDNFPTLVQVGQEVSFVKPTITDTVDGLLKVNYYVVVGGIETEIFEKDGNVSFNMDDPINVPGYPNETIYTYALKNGNVITIKTTAQDDMNAAAEATLDITVRNANDTQAIEIAQSVAGDFVANELPTITNTYKQGSVVSVEGVTFTDNDPNLTIIVTVRDANGNKVTGVKALGAIEKKTSGNDTVYAHPGVKFTATKAESYTVTYTAIDAGNNVVAYTVKLPTLSDSEKPSIVGVTSGKQYEIQLGQKLDLGRVTVVDNVDTGLVPTISCEAHPEYVSGTIFAPTEVGTYTVKYTAKDNNGNDADAVLAEVIVTDTTKPILTINNKDAYGTIIKKFTNESDATKFTAIELPTFSAADETFDFGIDAEMLNMSATAKLEITAPNGNTYTIDNTNEKYKISYVEANDCYSFVPTTKGTYTAKYTAVDASGNEAESYSITIMVGDTVPPTVDYTGELSANLKIGDTIKIHEDKITVTDKNSTEDLTFTSITVEDAAGNTIDYVKEGANEDIRAYTFDKAGTYTLTIIGRDEAGNTNSYTFTFHVTADASTTSFKDNVTGVVLIIVSLLILAGVIVYFAVSKKKISPKKTVKKVEKKEEKKEEKKD